ncbi:hypothetical protein [Micromonospora fluostatini]|uniref:hypothetical protein n=1 Tax=Micromonospora sp. JCM 30529 TaxID=3421643 RepID=UPI003D181B95
MSELRITPTGVQLLIFYSAPGDQEVVDLRHGVAEFAWVDAEHAAILAYRFGGPARGWSDVPYHPGHDPASGLPSGAGDSTGRLAVTVVLVNADTGLVLAHRTLTWPTPFVEHVSRTVGRMLGGRYDERAFEAAVTTLHRRHTTADALVDQRADAVCVAN